MGWPSLKFANTDPQTVKEHHDHYNQATTRTLPGDNQETARRTPKNHRSVTIDPKPGLRAYRAHRTYGVLRPYRV